MAEKERWVIINGVHVLIPEGKSVKDVMDEKFASDRDKFDMDIGDRFDQLHGEMTEKGKFNLDEAKKQLLSEGYSQEEIDSWVNDNYDSLEYEDFDEESPEGGEPEGSTGSMDLNSGREKVKELRKIATWDEIAKEMDKPDGEFKGLSNKDKSTLKKELFEDKKSYYEKNKDTIGTDFESWNKSHGYNWEEFKEDNRDLKKQIFEEATAKVNDKLPKQEGIIYPHNKDEFIRKHGIDKFYEFDGSDLVDLEDMSTTSVRVGKNGIQEDQLLNQIEKLGKWKREKSPKKEE